LYIATEEEEEATGENALKTHADYVNDKNIAALFYTIVIEPDPRAPKMEVRCEKILELYQDTISANNDNGRDLFTELKGILSALTSLKISPKLNWASFSGHNVCSAVSQSTGPSQSTVSQLF
jgi:hypothetical protein